MATRLLPIKTPPPHSSFPFIEPPPTLEEPFHPHHHHHSHPQHPQHHPPTPHASHLLAGPNPFHASVEAIPLHPLAVSRGGLGQGVNLPPVHVQPVRHYPNQPQQPLAHQGPAQQPRVGKYDPMSAFDHLGGEGKG